MLSECESRCSISALNKEDFCPWTCKEFKWILWSMDFPWAFTVDHVLHPLWSVKFLQWTAVANQKTWSTAQFVIKVKLVYWWPDYELCCILLSTPLYTQLLKWSFIDYTDLNFNILRSFYQGHMAGVKDKQHYSPVIVISQSRNEVWTVQV